MNEFQKSFSKYLRIRYCLGVANGTDALEISIKTLQLKKNSEIIVPANTWISTAEAVLNNGYKVKFVDIDETHNICIKDLKSIFWFLILLILLIFDIFFLISDLFTGNYLDKSSRLAFSTKLDISLAASSINFS